MKERMLSLRQIVLTGKQVSVCHLQFLFFFFFFFFVKYIVGSKTQLMYDPNLTKEIEKYLPGRRQIVDLANK